MTIADRMQKLVEARADLPRYDERKGWSGGDSRTLYAFVDKRTGKVTVRPGGTVAGIGPEVEVRMATQKEAEEGWQRPLSGGWIVGVSDEERPALEAELKAVEAEIDAAYWRFTRQANAKPPVLQVPKAYERREILRKRLGLGPR